MLLIFLCVVSVVNKATSMKIGKTDQWYVNIGIEKVAEALELDLTELGMSNGGDPMAQRLANSWAHYFASKRITESAGINEGIHVGYGIIWERCKKVQLQDVEQFKALFDRIRDRIKAINATGKRIGIGIGYNHEDLMRTSLTNWCFPEEITSHLVIVFTSVLNTDEDVLAQLKGIYYNLLGSPAEIAIDDHKLQGVANEWSTRLANDEDPDKNHLDLGFVIHDHGFTGLLDQNIKGFLKSQLTIMPVGIAWIQERDVNYDETNPPSIVLGQIFHLTIATRTEAGRIAFGIEEYTGAQDAKPNFLGIKLASLRGKRQEQKEDIVPIIEETLFVTYVIFPKEKYKTNPTTVFAKYREFMTAQFSGLGSRIRGSGIHVTGQDDLEVYAAPSRLILVLIYDDVNLKLTPIKNRINPEGMLMSCDIARRTTSNPADLRKKLQNPSLDASYDFFLDPLFLIYKTLLEKLRHDKDLSVGISVFQPEKNALRWVAVVHCDPKHLTRGLPFCTSVNPDI